MRTLKAILCLPFPVVVVIPAVILWATPFRFSGLCDWQLYAAAVLLLMGMSLAIWTVYLFSHVGKGTPAPWAPPQKLIVAGPYCYVRNPMLSGVFMILAAEVVYFQSVGVGVWLCTFIAINLLYFPLVEEPGLHKRFGAEYDEYCKHVPRYIPRFTPWRNTGK